MVFRRPRRVLPTNVTYATSQLSQTKHVYNVCDPSFDTNWAIFRAVKVYIASYPEAEPKTNPLHRQKFLDYVNQMKTVYKIKVDRKMVADMQNMHQRLRNENYRIVICPKRLKASQPLICPKFMVTAEGITIDRNLKITSEIQDYDPIRFQMSFDSFKLYRTDSSKKLSITVETFQWTQQGYKPNVFEFSPAESHPEGFEDWIDFGRGVQILIAIEYEIINEPNITPEKISEFHFETIIRILDNRLKEYNQKTQSIDIGHKVFAIKSKVTHRRPLIDPTTEQMFWSAPSTKQAIKVKFFELQKGYETAEDFEDSVCLCSEWCNWNAFFHYNPIYRFLLLRHNQLYVKSRTNLPDIYLCAAVIKGCFVPSSEKAPLLLLMNSANDYRRKYFGNYFMKDPHFKNEYMISKPHPTTLNAVSYNMLRYDLDITKRCHDLDTDPFSDLCIELMQNYFKILTDLHHFHSINPSFISNKRAWIKEMDSLNRHNYRIYFKKSYDLCISNNLGGYDYLFGVDYEYVDRIAQSAEAVYVKSIRDNVTKKIWADNPFNFKVISNDFLNMFTSVYKFLAKVESKLPTAYKSVAKREISECYKTFDADCEQYLNANKTFNFTFSLFDALMMSLAQNLTIFYTLKLYSYSFEVQRHCINSLLKYSKQSNSIEGQVCTQFQFIWRHKLVEEKYRKQYPGETLFEISPEISGTFNDFYEQYWGRPQHELTQSMNFLHYIDSGLFQYQKLYFWMKNNGNQRKKFTKILDTFNGSLLDVINRSELILNQWISPAINVLSETYLYALEVFDYLVYYLVKADCSMILSTTSTFFKQMHSLQTAVTVQNNLSYVLSKPGWVQLFRTLDSVLETIDKIKVNYIIFDDEFNRISNTCDQTKHMIKNIYRFFYTKLVEEWIEELKDVWIKTRISNTSTTEFVSLHLVVGLAFHSHFVNHFRSQFVINRKKLLAFLEVSPNLNMAHQIRLYNSRKVVINYLKDKNLIQEAQPFEANIWVTQLARLFAKLDQMTAQQLNIDMTAADT